MEIYTDLFSQYMAILKFIWDHFDWGVLFGGAAIIFDDKLGYDFPYDETAKYLLVAFITYKVVKFLIKWLR